nr:hypothetical protein [Enterococcus sp. BWB1-3]
MYILIICAGIAVLLLLIGDIFDFDGPIDPMLLIPWIAFTSLFGYLGEYITDWNHWLILLAGGAISTIIVFVLNFYLFSPMRNAESTISISERDMEGSTATVITPIPVNGMGEIQFKSVTGSLSRPAAFYTPQEKEVERGQEVLIIEVRDRVCYVVPYENTLKL